MLTTPLGTPIGMLNWDAADAGARFPALVPAAAAGW